MLRDDEYTTIEAPSEGIYKEKGSRFLSFAYNVENQEQAKEIINSIKKEYHDARHHCYAWRFGRGEENNCKSNDDGEPSGTAGRPILGQILSASLTNILIVVVRYFGGIKLGTGGLIVAYKTAAADAISNAKQIVRTFDSDLSIVFPYLSMNDVMKVIKDGNVKIKNQVFDTDCQIDFSIRQSEYKTVVSRFSDIEYVSIVEQ